MIIYSPRLIESAEQAEALPDGTIATSLEDYPAEKLQGRWANDAQAFSHPQMVGWTALVPVEVEVEYIRESGGRRREKTLYVTPWKDPR